MNIPPIARSGFDEIIRHIIVQIAQYRLNGIKTPKALRLIFMFDYCILILNIGLLNYFDKKVNYRNNEIKFVFCVKMMRTFRIKQVLNLIQF